MRLGVRAGMCMKMRLALPAEEQASPLHKRLYVPASLMACLVCKHHIMHATFSFAVWLHAHPTPCMSPQAAAIHERDYVAQGMDHVCG